MTDYYYYQQGGSLRLESEVERKKSIVMDRRTDGETDERMDGKFLTIRVPVLPFLVWNPKTIKMAVSF